ncbi:aminotransferase, class I/II [Gleimia coleocanis DSM 15436]|uniref:cysteine-S-conjugate beta-lyase n=1 Tax=Gleimia coleocanis DSM 15436 TaxID=525245 RepID=C0W154_9ACTO|nr:aminotransferase class I/II-fold pyridoxal phosphate-dependent enzyme [Gleimia coleocanis]EEH63543.1 aminotransferase, class I/II [Gleimia coleocanis DSM 15436]
MSELLTTPSISQLQSAGSLKWTAPDFLPASEMPVRGHWVAEMDYATAPVVQEAIEKAVKQQFYGYPPAWLNADLQRATANFQKQQYGWDVAEESVYPAASVLDVFRAFLKLLPAGSKILVPTPAYMPFLSIPQSFGVEVVQVNGRFRGREWRLDFDRLRLLAESAEALVLCNPWNPTGRVFTREELEIIRNIAVEKELLVFADEIHAPLVLPGFSHTPYASLPGTADHTVTATAASKAFNIPGLHSAQALVAADSALAGRWSEVTGFLGWSAPLGSFATIAAYDSGEPWLQEVRAYLADNLELAKSILIPESGWSWQVPQGGYLGFLSYDSGLANFAMLAEGGLSGVFFKRTGVATVPGSALGVGFSSGVRFNFASSKEVLTESLEALASFNSLL